VQGVHHTLGALAQLMAHDDVSGRLGVWCKA
jgi:hypothetical protein